MDRIGTKCPGAALQNFDNQMALACTDCVVKILQGFFFLDTFGTKDSLSQKSLPHQQLIRSNVQIVTANSL